MEHRQHCGEWARSYGSREPGQRCRSNVGGLDKAVRTSPGQSCISGYNRDGFHNGAYGCGHEDVAKHRWCSEERRT